MSFLLFILSLSLFFLSGWMFLRAVFGMRRPLSVFETAAFSFAIGVGILDFSMLWMGTHGIPFTGISVLLALLAVPATLLAARLAVSRLSGRRNGKPVPEREKDSPFSASRNERLAFLLVVALSVFLRTIFLSDAGLPTATDLGHHMYWSKLIADTGALPEYAKREILEQDGRFILSDPRPISDFIIGEHLPFSAIALLSGSSFLSAFPVDTLFLVNLLSLLSLFALAVRFAAGFLAGHQVSAFSAGLFVLFLIGPLFAFSSPESKFVSGGVVGNLFGNLFIPLILLALFRALRERDPRFLSIGIFLSFTLAYTHHLSSLVLLFVFAGILVSLLALFPRESGALARRIGRLFLSPFPLAALLFAGIFFIEVAMPTYIETGAVDTAIGEPSKSTRTGLSFFQVSDASGFARAGLGIAALLIALFFRSARSSAAFAFMLGWGGVLLVMALRPHWVFLDIPSNRIGTYLSFPLALLAGLFAASLPVFLKTLSGKKSSPPIPGRLFLFAVLVLFGFSTWNGSSDNQSSLPTAPKAEETAEVFGASAYLAARTTPEDLLLKDHNYLSADAWMKLFFMRGYEYPLSRGFFKRYEDETKPREQCTLLMISTPNLPEGRKCLDELGVNLIAVNPAYDAAQFEKSSSFSRIYAGEHIHVYERK